jgi:CheY-like chemotaxis protein
MRGLYLQSLLKDRHSDNAGASIVVTQFPCVLGRHAECDRRFADPLISRRHCELFVVLDDVWVRDLGSRNGTWVNGERLRCPRRLEDGDRLDIGLESFGVHLVDVPSAGESEPLARPYPGTDQRQHVLIVDDDDDCAARLAYILSQWGHAVDIAHDGGQAVALAQAHQPDTVLLDLHLAGGSGYEVAERLRTEAGLTGARLVAITADGKDEDEGRSDRLGFHPILAKPVALEALHEAMSDSL